MFSAYLIWDNTPMSSTPAFCFNFAIKVISCYMSETCNLKMEKKHSIQESWNFIDNFSEISFYVL